MNIPRYRNTILGIICCFCSVTKSCPTLCDCMDCSTPGFRVPRHLLEFAQVHVHCIGDAIQPSHPLSPPFLLPPSGTYPMSHLFPSDDQNTGASALVFPINIQGCSPLRLTGLISLLSKGLPGVFSSTNISSRIYCYLLFDV